MNEHEVRSAENLLSVRHTFWLQCRETLPAQEVLLTKIANISTPIVPSNEISTDTTKRLLNDKIAFHESYAVHVVEVRRLGILDDVMSITFLESYLRGAYVRCTRTGEMLMKRNVFVNSEPWQILTREKNSWTHATPCSKPLHFFAVDILFMIQSTDVYSASRANTNRSFLHKPILQTYYSALRRPWPSLLGTRRIQTSDVSAVLRDEEPAQESRFSLDYVRFY